MAGEVLRVLGSTFYRTFEIGFFNDGYLQFKSTLRIMGGDDIIEDFVFNEVGA